MFKISIYQERSKASGLTSLILQFYYNKRRRKRALRLYFKTHPQTELERQDKKEKLAMANRLKSEYEIRFTRGEYNIENDNKEHEDFVEFALKFIEQHAVKDKKKYYSVINKLQAFYGKSAIPCSEITINSLQRFVKVLESQLKGESPSNYFSKLKQIITAAENENYFKKNPASKIRVRQRQYIIKDVLTHKELLTLAQTPLSNQQVKTAFLFASITGLRWVDIKRLCWKHIQGGCIKLIQSKTDVLVSVPLTKDALDLIGEAGNPESKIFTLPSHNGACKALSKWVADAGIEKHITFHCARHTFGTSLIANGVDVSVASKLLGHTSLVNTQRYVRINESLKAEAIQKLPTLQINNYANTGR